MKIENLELIDFNKTDYSASVLNYDKNKMYIGYMDEESAMYGHTKSAAFGVNNLRIADNKLFGDFNLVNAPATELLTWISSVEVKPIVLGTYDLDVDEKEVLSADIISFVAYPNSDLI